MFIESIRKNKIGILIIFGSAICVCLAQMFWKLSIDGGSVHLLLGLVLYTVSALLMITAYKYGSLSVIHPFMSLTYVFAIILGFFVFQEPITLLKVFGILLIIISVILIGGGDN